MIRRIMDFQAMVKKREYRKDRKLCDENGRA
jgi:hypothetical protein